MNIKIENFILFITLIICNVLKTLSIKKNKNKRIIILVILLFSLTIMTFRSYESIS